MFLRDLDKALHRNATGKVALLPAACRGRWPLLSALQDEDSNHADAAVMIPHESGKNQGKWPYFDVLANFVHKIDGEFLYSITSRSGRRGKGMEIPLSCPQDPQNNVLVSTKGGVRALLSNPREGALRPERPRCETALRDPGRRHLKIWMAIF